MLRRQIVIAVVFIGAAFAIIAPRLASPQFGLLDDGEMLVVAERVSHDPLFSLDMEAARGRFRPLYWAYYIAQYPLWGAAPLGYFVVQYLVLAATSLVLCEGVRVASGSRLAGFTSGLAFLTAAPMWENYYTLSKPEPALVFFLAVSAFFLFKSFQVSATSGSIPRSFLVLSSVFVGLTYFTKETSVVMLPISIALVFITLRCAKPTRNTAIAFSIANIVWFCCYLVLRTAAHTYSISEGNDSLHYSTGLNQIYPSVVDALAWIIRDFAYAIPLILAASLFVRRRHGQAGARLVLGYGAVFSLGWILIMLPWHSSLEYYLLPLTLGVAMMVGASLEIVRRGVGSRASASRVGLGAALLSSLVLWPVPLTNGFTNARVQLAVDAVNVGLLEELARALPSGGNVLIDLPEGNEYVFEIGVQLQVLYERSHLQVAELSKSRPIADSEALIVIPQVTNRQVVMPRIAAFGDSANPVFAAFRRSLSVEPTRAFAHVRQVGLLFVAPEEAMCNLLRGMGARVGVLCQDPKLFVDQRTFTYGWELYRLAR